MRVVAVDIPGAGLLADLASALQTWATPLFVVAFIVCVIGWGVTRGASPRAAEKFMTGMWVSAAAALLTVAAPVLVRWAQGLGGLVS